MAQNKPITEDFDDWLRRNGITGTGGWACPGTQKQEAHHAWATRHGAKDPKMDDELCSQFYLAVEVKVSDRRRRDLDGCLATLCDCITAARRQLEDYSKHLREGEDSAKG